jgi:dihydroorotate dehydrogenase (fumarate)
MVNIETNYLGLKLTSPIIVASSGISNNIEKIKELEAKGAGAIVLKSLFEEQILAESSHNISQDESYGYDVHDYITAVLRDTRLSDYTKHIKEAKKATKIPIIASINCISDREWLDYTSAIEKAGADAIELNIGILPSDHDVSSEENEEKYFKIIEKVRKSTKLPIALKMSQYSAGLANLIKKLSWTGHVDAFVLFNRYFRPDIDIENMKITSTGVFSSSEDISDSLRWVAIMSNVIEVPIAATTGIHTGTDVIKQILVGAQCVQVASTLYQNGNEQLSKMNEDVKSWMEKKKFKTLDDFRGKMAFDSDKNTVAFERIQFMKHFGGIE